MGGSNPRVLLGEDGQRRTLQGQIRQLFGVKARMPDYLETIGIGI